MLKYNIRNINLRTQLKELELDGYDIMDIYTDSNDTCLLVCYLPDDVNYKLSEGMKVYLRCTITVDNENGLTESDSDFSQTAYIKSINSEKGLFTIIVDKYYDIPLNDIVETNENSDNSGEDVYWYFYFGEKHLFAKGQDGMVFYDDNGDIDSDSGTLHGETVIYIDYANITGDIITLPVNCEYEDPTILKIDYTANSSTLEDLRDVIYNEKLDGFVISSLRIYRKNPYWSNHRDLHVYIDEPVCALQIPLTQNFETNMFIGYGIREKFVDTSKEETIGSITEMEKDVYVPVIWDSEDDAIYEDDSNNGEVYKIEFNLHFRQHRGDDWLADVNSYWNGVIDNDGKLSLINTSRDDNNGENYFVFGDDKNDIMSSQSDLLTYLGFTDNDVKYQKNKLKKSFLRLLFYDSINPANQHLLHYSTIFMDTGKLFKKYIKGVEDTPYSTIVYDTDSEGNEISTISEFKTDKVGIRVDREPYGVLLDDCEDDEDIEEYRLSSRFVAEDRYDAEKSSEGFYLYLWKDNDGGFAPTDIYMKVEFNHAGYGRTIPFMMPFYDIKVDGKNGLKSFEEILDDWSDDETKYGAKKYLKYSYIHLKYRYDKISSRHVYYLDDTVYGDDVYFENNKIVFNLYEAKMV